MGFVLCYGVEILILGVYAICWQQIIKKVDISVAYSIAPRPFLVDALGSSGVP